MHAQHTQSLAATMDGLDEDAVTSWERLLTGMARRDLPAFKHAKSQRIPAVPVEESKHTSGMSHIISGLIFHFLHSARRVAGLDARKAANYGPRIDDFS